MIIALHSDDCHPLTPHYPRPMLHSNVRLVRTSGFDFGLFIAKLVQGCCPNPGNVHCLTRV